MENNPDDLMESEKWIIISALKGLHNLKYLQDLVLEMRKSNELQDIMNESLAIYLDQIAAEIACIKQHIMREDRELNE
jgi:hypothetical protein